MAGLALMVLLTNSLFSRVVSPECDPRRNPTCYTEMESYFHFGVVDLPTEASGAIVYNPALPPEHPHLFAEVHSRLTWTLSVLFFGLTISITFAFTASVIGRTLWKLRKSRVASALILALSAAVLTVKMLLFGGRPIGFNALLLGPLNTYVPAYSPYVEGVETLGETALAALSIAASCVLLEGFRRRRVRVSTDHRIADLLRSQRHVRHLLYVGTFSLVAGALQASALYAWASTMLSATGAPIVPSFVDADLKNLPAVMGGLNGSFYSILLASIFIPTFLLLRGQAYRLAEETLPEAPPSERSRWLMERGIEGTFPQQIVSSLAMLAPALAGGPLTSLINMIAGI